MLTSVLPSVGVVFGAEKSTIVRNGKILVHEKKRLKFQVLLRLVLPSVVVISGAGMKCTIVSNDTKIVEK